MAGDVGHARREARACVVAGVIWSPRATVDIEDIRAFIGNDSPLAAQRMALRLKNSGESLAMFPDRGRQAGRGMRELTIIYPYLIRYRIRDGHAEIVRVKHGAQRPR